MLLKITQAGDPVLRQRARLLVTDEIRTQGTQRLLELMRATMEDASGVGLAAPQVGESLRLIVIGDERKADELQDNTRAELEWEAVPFRVLINPVVTVVDPTSVRLFESCLSIQGYTAIVPRPRAIRVTALNERAEEVEFSTSRWTARIIQHEVDHLDGVLYSDRMEARSFMTAGARGQHWRGTSIADICEALGIPSLTSQP